ncbi:hypothetical protein [Embleya sp. NPDC059259]|uniref:DUF6414 family protein n=1 Tax=unclassified Embleya TaxID=2699296 RepID=UPI0036D0DBE7
MNQTQMSQAADLARLLDRLMVGLVPVQCVAVDYRALEYGGQNYVVHTEILSQFSTNQLPPTLPVSLVGVAEQALFWKDIRRVLFADARARVLCRVSHPGLKNSWTPIKLGDVLSEIWPEFTNIMDNLGSDALAAMSGGNPSVVHNSNSREVQTLQEYGSLIARSHSQTLTPQDDARILALAQVNASLIRGDVADRRRAFEAIEQCISAISGVQTDRREASNFRVHALALGGFMSTRAPSAPPQSVAVNERFIEAEIIAIYW